MLLWTIQGPQALRQLRRDGHIRIPRGASDPDYRRAYRWLTGQMRLRGLRPPCADLTPVWLWTHPCTLREDGRRVAAVRLKVDVPFERLLISDFDMWHFVLNQGYASRNAADDRRNDIPEVLAAWRAGKRSPKWVRDSWQRIFPLEPEWHECSPRWSRGEFFQATTWEIRESEILQIKEYPAPG